MKITAGKNKHIFYSGADLDSARAAMILIHGRGADAPGILALAEELDLGGMAYAAPQAEGNTWYPYSFLEPVERNEPRLSESLEVINSTIEELTAAGFTAERVYLLGFSQGACLALEYAARYPRQYGGIIGLSGGLIGKSGASFEYEGIMSGTPVFLGCSDVDPHIPLERVNLTEKVFTGMNASVTKRIYPGMGHTVNREELDFIRKTVQGAA